MLHIAPPTVMRDLLRPDVGPVLKAGRPDRAAAPRRRPGWLPAVRAGRAGAAQKAQARCAAAGTCVAGCDSLC